MVENRHNTVMRRTAAHGEIARVQYDPPTGYGLDIEIFPLSELRRRVSADHLRTPKRIDFYQLLYFAEGRSTLMVDFESMSCKPGSLYMLRPGQVHLFETFTDWQGWLVLFRPEFLQAREAATVVTELEAFHQLEALPVHLALDGREQEAVAQIFVCMFQDAQLPANPKALHALLRHELLTILVRLHLIQTRCERTDSAEPILLERFKKFRLTVEQNFHDLRRVSDYATLLGCSEKSLGRASSEVAGIGAKAFLSQRIALEAKRLLVHTGLPASAIADRLGFDEATNFVKFFRREVGCSPGVFRQQQRRS